MNTIDILIMIDVSNMTNKYKCIKKNLEEKIELEKKCRWNTPIGFFHVLKGLLRLLVFLPLTIFLVIIFLIFKATKTLKIKLSSIFNKEIMVSFNLRLFGLKLKVIGKQSYNSTIFVSNHISWTDIL